MPEVGDVITVNNLQRKIVDIKTNAQGLKIVCWESNRGDVGACVPSLWEKWKTTKIDEY